MATYTPQQLGISAPAGGFQKGGWYEGRQYWDGTLSDPGVIHPSSDQAGAGQAVSKETVQQTNPDNWQYIQQQSKVSASEIKSPTQVSLPSQTSSGIVAELQAAQKALEQNLATRQTQTQEQLAAARAKEQATLEEAKPLTEPFREKIETEGREKYGTEEVLGEQKALLDELDQLLTEGNELIRQQQQVTGLAAIRNPRIQQTMEDVAARAGVINAVVNLQNTYLANAYQSIDRTIANITADRQDRLNYYNTVLSLANRDIIELTKESRNIANAQIALLEKKMDNAQATVNTVKQLMLDPASALLMTQAGVSLNDSVETINAKMAEAQFANEVRDMANQFTSQGGVAVTDPSTVPASQLKSFTDSRGQVHYYKIPKSGSGAGGSSADNYLLSLKSEETTKTTAAQSDISQAPQFSPSGGYGTIWVDPATGTMWQFTKSGWRKVT
ncbi:MAG: hypothetical protein WC346_04260 [Methanogenium sp.]